MLNTTTVLKKVQKLIDEKNTDLSLTELLDKANQTETDFVNALESSCTCNIVMLKHEPHECWINNCNLAVMLAWQANIDIQFGLNAYACVMYVASHIMNGEILG